MLRDARGRVHALARAPERIVSLVPSVTESLFALGCGSRVVGVTEYCVAPDHARRDATVIGGTKTPRCDAIVALRPDLVLANREENRALDVRRLEARGVRVFVLYARSVLRAARELSQLGALLGVPWRAAAHVAEIRGALARGRPKLTRPPRTVALVWKDPYMAVGGDCYAHDLIVRAGGVNPFADAGGRRYPHVAVDALVAASPDVVLLPSEPYAFSDADRDELATLPCPAARKGRIHHIDGALMTWPGPRSARALATLCALLADDEATIDARAEHVSADGVR
jgi:ABC-type hemin transport system substrate-binding protein